MINQPPRDIETEWREGEGPLHHSWWPTETCLVGRRRAERPSGRRQGGEWVLD